MNAVAQNIDELMLKTKVWRKVLFGGNLATLASVITAKKAERIYIGNDGAEEMIRAIVFPFISGVPETVKIANVSNRDLGITRGAPYGETLACGLGRGFRLFRPEYAPQLRLDYKKQPPNEWLRCAMKPIVVRGFPLIFSIVHLAPKPSPENSMWPKHKGRLELRGGGGKPDFHYDADTRFLFELP